jgi:branched-chain amino acid transport system permease protein
MQLAVTTVINMLVLSSMYILVALGFVFLFNIMGILNFAHGVIYMVGGYLCFELAVGFGLNLWLALVLTVVVVGGLGLFLERFCFGPFIGNLNLTIVICIGIILVLQNTVNMTVGTSTRSIPAFIPGVIKAGMISISAQKLITFIIGGALLGATLWFFKSTRLGQQMQAAFQNLEGAALQGINIHHVSAIACIIACGLAALAGSLMGAYLNLTPFMGDDMLVKVLEILILGGIGTISGTLFAGLIIGSMDAVLPLFISGAASQAVSLGIIIAILLFRPRGFFGREVS